MNRSDTGRQVKPGLGRISRPNRDDDGDEDDVTTADSSHDAGEPDGDESGDEKNESAPQHAADAKIGGVRDEYEKQEASEIRQKSGNMGQRGMKASGGRVQGQEISDHEEMENPAKKAIHGRGDSPSGHRPQISGAYQGPGGADHGEPSNFTNLGHGEREAKMSGAHQGQHGNTHETDAGGFEGGGRLSKEHARGPTGAKR